MLGKLKMLVVVCALALVAPAIAGCGEEKGARDASTDLVVAAASSLKGAFSEYAKQFDAADVKTSFGGSDELAAQIEKGLKPDVLAAANMKIPDQLYAKGLVEKPVVFAGNRLVIAVPADAKRRIDSIDDLEQSGVKIAAGSESVPVGGYTRKLLAGMPAAERKAILGNFRSNEPDVKGVVGKVAAGAVDAGFVYATDVEASNGKLVAVELPESLQPSVAYGVAVVKGARHPELARQFIGGLLSGDGLKDLAAAGFEPPPPTDQ